MAVTITNVDPKKVPLGATGFETDIIGTELDTADLEAAIMLADKSDIDMGISVGQPFPPGVGGPTRFPISITVVAPTGPGSRAVVIKKRTENLEKGACPKGSTTCYILDKAIELT